MRFLIAFILSFCLYFNIAHATENKAIAGVQNFVIKPASGLSITHSFNKKEKNKLTRDFYDEHIKLINQTSNQSHLFYSIGLATTIFNFNPFFVKSSQVDGQEVDDYRFILAHLYP